MEWTGDLNDDCFCIWQGMDAHCEKMHDRPESWYIGVYRGSGPAVKVLFHSGEHEFGKCDGVVARLFAEQIMLREHKLFTLCEGDR